MTGLVVSRAPAGLLLGDAVGEAFGAATEVTGIAYTPEAVALGPVLCDRSGLQSCPGQGADTPFARAFEAVCFSPDGTLRWQGEIGGEGRAVFTSRTGHVPDGWSVDPVPQHLSAVASRQVFWGRAAAKAPAPGWSRLVEARIGRLDVPLAVPQGKGVALCQTAYFSCEDVSATVGSDAQDGNPRLVAMVVDGLEVVERTKSDEKGSRA